MNDRLIQGLEAVGAALRGCVLTIGNFDGVHLGHQLILQMACALADAEGALAVAMTFDPTPDLVLRPGDQPQRLTPHAEKCRLLLTAGADYVVTVRPDREFLAWTARQFIDRVILERLAPQHVVEGPNFFFGRGRSGTLETLQAAGRKAGFTVHAAEPVVHELREGPVRISSTLIRGLIADGRIEQANRCLGRPFALYGRVAPGQGRGRLLEFPTANLEVAEQVCPADGVYAGIAQIDGLRLPAAISIGNKPTFGPRLDRAVEAFLIGATGDFYDKHMALSFVQRLRDQERFDSAEALQAQIAKDVELVRQICG